MSRDGWRRLALSVAARLLPAAPAASGPPRRLLLIRPDHLGDVLLLSPAVAELRAALPNAHLTLLVGPWSAEVARRGAEVDAIQTCEFPGFARRPKRHPLEPYLVLSRVARQISGRYDLAVVFRPDHWWGGLLVAVAGVPIRLGWSEPLIRRFLTTALARPDSIHAARLNLILARQAASTVLACWDESGNARSRMASPAAAEPVLNEPQPIFRVTRDEREWAEGLTHELGKPLVLLHPGSGSPLKSWPPARWAAVADALIERGACVALTGGPDDPAGPAAVATAMRHEPLSLSSATSLGQLAALSERCSLALGVDSGPLHLAAALGAPTLRLYGPTDEALFGPWPADGEHGTLTNPLPCRPCGNLIAPPCGAQQEPPCLLGIETDGVIERALEHLAARRAGGS